MMRVKVLEMTSRSKSSLKSAYEKLYKQYNLLYGMDHLEKQNESLQRIETSLIDTGNQRRTIQKSLNEVQDKIRETRNLIDKTPRNSDNFLVLITQEHKLIKEEYDYIASLKLEEEKEKSLLNLFSENIRKTHQLDVIIQSRQKLLAFVYSVVAGIIGFSTHAYVNRHKLEFFQNEINKIKGQHEVTLVELHHVSQKLDEIRTELTRPKEVPAPLPPPEVPKATWSYSSLLSYPLYPFVSFYKMLF